MAVLVTLAAFAVSVSLLAGASIPPGTRAGISDDDSTAFQEFVAGWKILQNLVVVRALLFLSVFINIASFIGPMYPALIVDRLQGNASVYGLLQAVEIIAGVGAGIVAGGLERRMGAGWLVTTGWSLAGLALLGMALSVHIPLTLPLAGLVAFGLVSAGIALNTLIAGMVPDEYRGRVFGLFGSLSAIGIPISTLIAGGLADVIGVAAMFAIAGGIVLVAALSVLGNRSVREARM